MPRLLKFAAATRRRVRSGNPLIHVFEVVVLALALVCTVVVSYVTVKQQGEHFEAEQAYYFIRRWNDLQQYNDRLAAELMLADFEKELAEETTVDVKTWLNEYCDRDAAASFYSDINLLTELAQGYFQGKVDRELIDVLLGTVYPRYFGKARLMVEERNRGVPAASRVWQSFLSMCYVYEPSEVTAEQIASMLGRDDTRISVGVPFQKLER
ncbi:MAG: hypothetical protein AAFY46_01480, partial [Planctomycetota bacterium]